MNPDIKPTNLIEGQAKQAQSSNPWNRQFSSIQDFPKLAELYPFKTPADSFKYLYTRTNPKDFSEWLSALKACAAKIQSVGPSEIFIAMRGASPFMAVVTEFLPKLLQKIPVIPLRIGTVTYLTEREGVVGLDYFGFNTQQKEAIIAANVVDAFAHRSESPFLIDEVQAGSTVTVASKILLKTISASRSEKINLNVVTIEDRRQSEDRLVQRYRELRLGKYPQIDVTAYHSNLFSVDSLAMLDVLFYQPTELVPSPSVLTSDLVQSADIVCVRNDAARAALQDLTRLFISCHEVVNPVEFIKKFQIGEGELPQIAQDWLRGFLKESQARNIS